MSITDRLQGIQTSVAIKAPCRVTTSTNITLSGFQTIGSTTLAEDDENLRVLVKDQTTASENGIYNAASGTWERAADFDGARDVVQGTLVPVNSGSDTVFYRVSTADPIVIGTTSITFAAADVLAADAAVTAAEAAQTAAEAAATLAEAHAEAASENASERLVGTSTSSVAIGTGSKSFTTEADKYFTAGTFLLISSDADPATNWMFGQSTAYSGTSLTVDVLSVGGSGTLADWTIRVSGARGATGAVGASGEGSGDLVSTNNLDDVDDVATARTNLGLAIGTNVQAYDAVLADLSGLTLAQGDVLYYNGSNLVNLGPGTDGYFLKTQGAGANPVWAEVVSGSIDAPYDKVLFNRNTANKTTTSASLADVTNLTFAIGSSETWDFEATIYANCDTGTATVCFSMNGPASPSSVAFTVSRIGAGISAISTHTSYESVDTTQGDGDYLTTITGRIVNGSNAGTVATRFRRSSSSGGGTSTVYRNSTIKAWRIA